MSFKCLRHVFVTTPSTISHSKRSPRDKVKPRSLPASGNQDMNNLRQPFIMVRLKDSHVKKRHSSECLVVQSYTQMSSNVNAPGTFLLYSCYLPPSPLALQRKPQAPPQCSNALDVVTCSFIQYSNSFTTESQHHTQFAQKITRGHKRTQICSICN